MSKIADALFAGGLAVRYMTSEPQAVNFQFGARRDRIDWRLLHGVDLERVVRRHHENICSVSAGLCCICNVVSFVVIKCSHQKLDNTIVADLQPQTRCFTVCVRLR